MFPVSNPIRDVRGNPPLEHRSILAINIVKGIMHDLPGNVTVFKHGKLVQNRHKVRRSKINGLV